MNRKGGQHPQTVGATCRPVHPNRLQPNPLSCQAAMTDHDETAPFYEPRMWRDHGWTARVIRNNDDEGWAAEMNRQGEPEPALVSP